MKKLYNSLHLKWVSLFFIFFLAINFCFGQAFTENFNTNTGESSTFTKTLSGVQFDFTFTSDNGGGVMRWESGFGDGNSASVNLESNVFNIGSIERVTIKRQDGNTFIFSGIFINNDGGQTITVQGYNGVNPVGSSQTVGNGGEATLNFPNITVTEVRLISTDFINSNIDSFRGEVISNSPPTASSFSPSNGPFENLTHTFSTTNFGYFDSDGNPLSHILIESVPGAGTLYLDANNSDSFNSGEAVGVGAQISKANLDAGNLQYIQNGSVNTSFQFEVNDGTVNSSGNYIATLNVSPVPTVTLSVTPLSKIESVATNTEIRATLSNTYGAPVVVNLGFSGTATGSGLDYSVTGTSITINPVNTTGTVNLTNIPDALYEGNETVVIDITSVTNGVESGTQQQTFTIIDDDSAPTVSLEVVGFWNPITNEDGGQAYVRAKMSSMAGATVTVPLSFSGTASGGGTDYSVTGTTISLSPGETMDSIRVTSLSDTFEEGDETIIITMGTPTNGIKGTPDQVTLTIIDEDAEAPKDYTVEINQDPILPSNSSNVSFTFSGAEIGATYNYLFTSSAGGSTISDSGTISSTNETISPINLSGMADGTITLSVDLTDSFNNTGATVQDIAEKLASMPPFLTGVPTDITVVEEVASNIDLSGTTFGDPDAAVDDILEISFLVDGGTLSFESGIGITVSQPIPGAWKISGTISNLNSYLSDATSIKYTSNPGVIGDNAGSIGLTGSDGAVGASFGSINLDVREIPSVTSVSVPANGTYFGTQNLNFTVNYSEAVTVSGVPSFEITIGSTVYDAEYVSGSGSSALLFRYTLQPGDLDPNGISVGGIISLNGGSIKNSFALDAELSLNSVGSTTAVLVDAVAPQVTRIERLNPTSNPTNADALIFRVTFSEAVVGVNAIDFNVTGPSGASIGVTGSGSTYDVTVSGGDMASLNGVATLSFAAGQNITDLAGNALINISPTETNDNEYILDNAAPTVSTLSPADNTTEVSLNSDFGITFTEDVVANTGNLTVHRVSDDGVVRTFDVTNSALVSIAGAVVTFNNTSDLALGTEYYVLLDNGAFQDEAGNAFGGIISTTSWSFTTSVQTQISIDDPTLTEGNAGSSNLIFTVSLSQPAPAGGATVDYATSNGTATAGSDYTAASGTLSFAVGESSKTVNISIIGDEILELDETFTLTLSNPSGTNVGLGDFNGIGTIQNDDTAAVTISGVSGNEDDGAITLTAILDNAVQDGFTVNVSTSDGTATVADNDYTAVTGQTLTFVGIAGETQTFTVTPTLDLVIESDETLSVSQSNLAGTSLAVDISDGAIVTILNDDSAPSGYTVAWDDLLINDVEAQNASFTVSNAEVGTTIFYSISSEGDGNIATVPGSTAVVNPNQVVNVDVSSLVDGRLTVVIYLQDAGGNNGGIATDNSAVLDQTAPLAPSAPDLAPSSDTGLSNSDNITADNTPTITGTAEANSVVTLYRDNISVLGSTTADGAGNWTFTSPVIPDGVYIISTDATDEAGNTSPKSAGLSITFDTTSPVTPSSPDLEASSDTGASDSDNITSNTTLTFIGTAEAGSTVKLYSGANLIGSSTATGGNWSSVSSTLAEGIHQITATATDVAGNISVPSSAIQVEIDTQAPPTPSAPHLAPGSDSGVSNSDNLTNDRTPTVQGTAEPNSTIVLFSSEWGDVEVPVDASGNWTYTYGTNFPSGPTFFRAKEVDLAGNESTNSDQLNILIDYIAPVVVVNNPIIQLNANGQASLIPSDIILNLSDNYSSVANISLELTQNSFDCSDLGARSIYLNATDEAGNTSSWLSTITVQDKIGPEVRGKDITLNVDAFGSVTVFPNMVDDGSSDACGISSSSTSPALFTKANEGVNDVTFSVTDVNGNTNSVIVKVTIVVVPKVLNVTVDPGQSKIYGDLDPAFTYLASGFEPGDDVGILTGALSRDPGSDVGNYAITLGTLDAGPNYTINFIGSDFEITPATLEITADAGQSKIYGNIDPALTYQAAGFKNGDDESLLSGELSRATGENVGVYAINIGTLDAGLNYTINFTGATFAITPATITGITFNDESFVYDGTVHSLAIGGTLPTGTSVTYLNNSRTDVGTQEVTATISGSNFTTLVLTADLTVTPATVTGITFDDESFVYDGTVHSLAIGGTLPTGTSVTYTNNVRTDVGTQEVTATITGSNFTTLVLTADLTVTPATVTGITFDDESFVFDGTVHSLAIGGTLPTGTSVTYTNNVRTDVGTQEVTATITGSNFTTLVLTADLTVTPATVTGITFDDESFVYDGTAHSLAIGGTLPTGTSVTYTNNGRTDVGTQEVTATITGSNFTTLVLTADLTVTPATVTGITFDDESFVFDGTSKSLTIGGTLPTGTSVTYTNNGRTDVGTQEVTATITGSNFTTLVLTADLTVTPAAVSGITFDDESFVFDGTVHSLAIDGTLPTGTSVAYTNNDRTDVGTQEVTATITGSNFTTLVLTADLTVTPATVTGITFDDDSFVFNGTSKSLTIGGTLPTGTSVTYTNNGRTDVGTQEVTATITGSNFTTLVLTADLTVTPATVTGITFDDESFVYDGTAHTLVIGGTLPTGTSVTYTNNGRTDVGTQEVTATITGSNFSTLVLTADLTVTPATVTGITFDDESFVYDGTAKSLAIGGTLPTGTSVTYTNNGRTDMGIQEVTATITGSNFTTLVLTADLTVTPATVTGITFDDESFVYDGTAHSLTIGGTLPTGTSVTYLNNSRTDVGTQEVTATITGSNFTTLLLTADLTVTPATLDITADAGQSKVYGDLDPVFTYQAIGFEGGDDETILTGMLTRITGEEVGMFAINQGSLSAGSNYTISFTGADFEITPATLDITADVGQSKVYGGADPVFTYASSGFKNGDTQAVISGSLDRALGENVGFYAIQQGSINAGGNYTINYTAADFEITPATLDITANAGQVKIYGSSDPELTYQVTGYQNGDDAGILSGELARTVGENVGMYPINLGTLNAGPNYLITFNSADFEITTASLTVSANPGLSKIYGNSDPVFTYVASGFQNGDTQAILTGVLSRTSGENVGTYAISLGNLSAGANYTISFTGADFEITARTLNINVNPNQAKVYGSADPVFAFTASNFGNGDNISVLTGALSRIPGENVGMYAITLGTLDAGANYMINFTSAEFEIATKVLDVTADAGQSKVFGAADPILTYQVTGFENGDDGSILTGTLARTVGENVGSYAINLGTLDAGSNYAINYTGASFAITKATITGITFADDSFVFDGTAKSLAISGTLPTGTTVAYTNNSRINVGLQEVTATVSGLNYTTLVLKADLTVTPATVTGITFDDESFVYDGTAKSLMIAGTLPSGTSVAYTNNSRTEVGTQEVTATISGLNYNTLVLKADLTVLPSDIAGLAFEDGSFEYDGTAKSLAITGTLPAGTSVNYANNSRTEVGTQVVTATISGSNFTEITLTAELSITPASLMIMADEGQGKEFGSVDPELTFKASGFKGADTDAILSGALSREPGEEVGSYDITLGSLSSGSNYTIDFIGAKFMIFELANDDTDGDGVPDLVEEDQGTDPNDPSDYLDSDGDDVPDYVEGVQGTDPADEGDYVDTDGDDVPDYVEEQQGTDSNDETDFLDEDEDGIPDYVQVRSVTEFVTASLEALWGTEAEDLKVPMEVVLVTAQGEFINLPVTWDLTGYDPLMSGVTHYSGTVELPEGLFNPDEFQPMLEITVLAKPAPQDVTLSANSFIGIPDLYFQEIGAFTVIDPTDNIHMFSLPAGVQDNDFFEVLDGILFWSSAEQAGGRTEFTILLQVTDRAGNVLEKSFQITRLRTPLSQLDVPNTFTPNGDGVNDTWGVLALRYYTGVRISILSVGGDRVFYTENPDVQWDGIFNGKEMPVGAYLYVIEVGETGEIRRGMLNLLRQ